MPAYTTKLRGLSDRELEDLIDVIGEVLGVDTGEWSGSRMEDAKQAVKQALQAEA